MNRVLTGIENGLASVTFLVITVVAFANVISRYFLNASLAFTTELVVNLAVWLTMLGAVMGVREGAHLGFSALHEQLRGRVKDIVTVLIAVLMALFFLVLLRYGFDLALQQAERNRTTPSMRIPQWLFTAALPVCSALGILRTVQVTWNSLRGVHTDDGLTEGRVIA